MSENLNQGQSISDNTEQNPAAMALGSGLLPNAALMCGMPELHPGAMACPPPDTDDSFEQHLSLPTGDLNLHAWPDTFEVEALIGVAARANAKRGFLFLSRVLGKHWPATPAAMQRIHRFLAGRVPADLPGPVVVIAMAETAIGLGQGVFEAYLDQRPGVEALFLHSTRYRVGDAPLIEFEETHSHAPRQFLHLPVDPALRQRFLSARSLLLVDDEASTGNTFKNLADACRQWNPGLERVHLATITDFMGDAVRDGLSERFGLPVTVGAALRGEFTFTPGCDFLNQFKDQPPAQAFDPAAERGASQDFGRVGLSKRLSVPVALADRLAAEISEKEQTLVLGSGEFMYPAFLLARELERRGCSVVVQASTRSPILKWGAVGNVMCFPDNYGEGLDNYLYNVSPGQYQHVLICHETPANEALHQLADLTGGRLFHFKSKSDVEEIPVRGS